MTGKGRMTYTDAESTGAVHLDGRARMKVCLSTCPRHPRHNWSHPQIRALFAACVPGTNYGAARIPGLLRRDAGPRAGELNESPKPYPSLACAPRACYVPRASSCRAHPP